MRIVFLTAGAAGMYCGSCMHDNALAKAMRELGDDVLLQPIYTPIRTDQNSIANPEVYFGGIHVYLLQQYPLLAKLPRFARSWLDRPGLIRLATRRAVQTDPAKLGELTISMLQGRDGRQVEEVDRMVNWLAAEIQPDVVLLSNLLIGGVIPAIKQRLPKTRIVVTLQGDDIFLDHLPDAARSEAIGLLSSLSESVDTFVTHSKFYRDKMGELLGIDETKFQIHPLSIDLRPYQNAADANVPLVGDDQSRSKPAGEFRIGYLARVAPEKGLHTLVEAFEHLATEPGNESVTLHVAGWLGEHNHAYLKTIRDRISADGLSDRFVYHGSPGLADKVSLLKTFDVLSVPTTYEDPKGLFALEAMAVGVPVVLPDHGAFGELIQSTGGGKLFPPQNWHALAKALVALKNAPEERSQLVASAIRSLPGKHDIQHAAQLMHATCRGTSP